MHCEVALQHWTIKHTNVVRIEGGAEPVTVTVETTVQRHLARNAAAPSLGIEATDEWTTEDRLRKDPPLGKDQEQLVVQCALRRCLALRVDALRTELGARTMPEADRAAELAWLTYFVTPTWKPDDPDSEGQGRVIALARAHW